MAELLITVIVAVVVYLLPGYSLLQWFKPFYISIANRIILSLVVTLIIVPYTFVVIANFFPFKPGLVPWSITLFILLISALLLRFSHRNIKFRLTSGQNGLTEKPKIQHIEIVAVFLYLVAFATFVNLPRVLMFLHGSYALEVQPWDEHWHIQELVSVARTGIPPRHYFFPSIELAYYYASWILPAILGNLPGITVSLMRAMSIHTFFQIFAFLGLVYIWLQYNIKNWWARILGIGFCTFLGGFDLFAKLPGIEFIDWWIKDPSWLIGNLQINQPATLYAWVPHHLSASMAFLALVILWRNTQTSPMARYIGTGILLGFILITSPFVFIFTSLAIGIVFLTNWKCFWVSRRTTLIALLAISLFFTVVAWYPLLVYSNHKGTLTWNDVRINLFERFRGGDQIYYLADRALTILGFPLVMSVFLTIDIGLAYLFYVLWWGERLFSKEKVFQDNQSFISGLFPVTSFLLLLLVKDIGGGGNFSMRGFIPAQIILILTSVIWADSKKSILRNIGWKKWVVLYFLTNFFFAQSLSTLAEVRSLAVRPLKLALWQECGWRTIGYPKGEMETCLPKDQYYYIYWLNKNTPSNALIIETGHLPPDKAIFRWLERNRILMPSEFLSLEFHYYDMDFILPEDWGNLQKQWENNTNVLDYYRNNNFRNKGLQPVYLVIHGNSDKWIEEDTPIYQDSYVSIFHPSNLSEAK